MFELDLINWLDIYVWVWIIKSLAWVRPVAILDHASPNLGCVEASQFPIRYQVRAWSDRLGTAKCTVLDADMVGLDFASFHN